MRNLCLSRKKDEALWFVTPDGTEFRASVVRVSRGAVRLRIEAPDSVKVVREELRIQEAQEATP